MSWVVVPNLDELERQMDARFPNRSKASDGSIGDEHHAVEASSHNPDESGHPEFSDHDGKNEVRARDFTSDLKDPAVSMEQIVQLLITKARDGKLWWMRYLIYNGRIWHKRDGYVTRVYTGSNKHTEHMHVNSDFTEEADNVTNTNWFLAELGAPVVHGPHIIEQLVVDEELGPKTVRRWQEVMGTTPDGVIDQHDSELVRKVQSVLKSTVDRNLVVDGEGIVQDGHQYKTVFALQRYLKSPVDGRLSTPKSKCVGALQRRLNQNRF